MTIAHKRLSFLSTLLVLWFASAPLTFADGWLNGQSDAIWSHSPGFYKEGEHWYAILHTRPSTTRVELVGDFTDWESHPVELTRTPDHKFWWFKGKDSQFTKAPKAGDKYQFIITNGDNEHMAVQDPAARRVENAALSSKSIVTDGSSYQWHDGGWSRPGWEYYLIYQLHPLRFTDRHPSLRPLRQVTEEINANGTHDYLNEMHVTAIQLLPINEFPGDFSWGYNPSFFYAVESSYGSPDDLKELVDTAHQHGMAVILDLVYNHGGSSDNVLWQIAQNNISDGTYYDGDTVWGPMVNFDNDVARHYFVQNIVFLAKEYHIDAFRFDFTRPIHNPSDGNIRLRGTGGGWEFLREVREKIKFVDPRILLIAEELPNTWQVTNEDVGHSWAGDRHGPFDAQWADPFHDGLKAVLTGGHLNELFQVFKPFGDSWYDGLIYGESHDEVGNTDDRIAKRGRDGKGWEMSQLSATAAILSRGIPMIFMGQESGETMQFGQDDGKLPAQTAGAYDSGTGTTWWDDRLNLTNYESDPGRTKVRHWFQRMFDIRRGSLNSFAEGDIQISHVHNDDGVVAYTREQGKYLIVLNFKGKSWDNYYVGVSGRYQELANTSWPAFNLGASSEKSRGGDTAHHINGVHIPAYGAVVLVRWD
ncbi:MAG: 1,4-alpha-glucan branching protein [Nitrospira sp. WS110]|nr:1,4-alpha-glucan branching protein [Nitrospira sp. WS110]